jgi:hypothetical protein
MVNKKQATFNTTLKGCIEGFLNITKPMHKMTDQEIKIITLFLYYYNQEKENFVREADLWKFIFDYDTKLKVREELGISNPVFQNILTSLRKKKVIQDNKITSYYLLNIKNNDDAFELIFRFNIKK